MVKLNAGLASGTGPFKTEAKPSGKTYEGGDGYARAEQTDLYLLATTMFAGEDTFYEKGDQVNDRARTLVGKLAVEDWEWVQDFLPWLRKSANIRTMSIMLAAEAVHARLEKGITGTNTIAMPRTADGREIGPGIDTTDLLSNRQLIASVLIRPDEPCEMIAYWQSRFGKEIPRCVKRGVGDAVTRMWTERNAMRWDKPGRPVRFSDVLELCHPKPRKITVWAGDGETEQHPDPAQRALWDFLITERKGHLEAGDGHPDFDLTRVPAIQARKTLSAMEPAERHTLAGNALLNGNEESRKLISLASAGQWEWLISWLGETAPNALSKREQWSLVIPDLGYMALLRNLRNFDEASIKPSIAHKIQQRIADPDEVAKSKQLPFRFLAAYLNAPSLKWGQALEQALQACIPNIPDLDGRNLVLIDTSGSMLSPMSGGSKHQRGVRPTSMQAGALFGVALAVRNPGNVDVYGFADGQMRIDNIGSGASILKTVEMITATAGRVGYGTQIGAAVQACYNGHDRVFIFTDMQTMPTEGHPNVYGGDITESIPDNVHVYGFDLRGYANSAMSSGGPYRHEMGGLTDHTFGLIPMLEKGVSGEWPWKLEPAKAHAWEEDD